MDEWKLVSKKWKGPKKPEEKPIEKYKPKHYIPLFNLRNVTIYDKFITSENCDILKRLTLSNIYDPKLYNTDFYKNNYLKFRNIIDRFLLKNKLICAECWGGNDGVYIEAKRIMYSTPLCDQCYRDFKRDPKLRDLIRH